MIKATKKYLLRKVIGIPEGISSEHKNVYAYLNNLLSEEEKEIFTIHLGKCPDCLDTVVKWHYKKVMDDIEMSLPDEEIIGNHWELNWDNSLNSNNDSEPTIMLLNSTPH